MEQRNLATHQSKVQMERSKVEMVWVRVGVEMWKCGKLVEMDLENIR